MKLLLITILFIFSSTYTLKAQICHGSYLAVVITKNGIVFGEETLTTYRLSDKKTNLNIEAKFHPTQKLYPFFNYVVGMTGVGSLGKNYDKFLSYYISEFTRHSIVNNNLKDCILEFEKFMRRRYPDAHKTVFSQNLTVFAGYENGKPSIYRADSTGLSFQSDGYILSGPNPYFMKHYNSDLNYKMGIELVNDSIEDFIKRDTSQSTGGPIQIILIQPKKSLNWVKNKPKFSPAATSRDFALMVLNNKLKGIYPSTSVKDSILDDLKKYIDN